MFFFFLNILTLFPAAKAEAPLPVPASVASLSRSCVEEEDEGIVKEVENYRFFVDPPPESFMCQVCPNLLSSSPGFSEMFSSYTTDLLVQICKDVFLEPVILTGCGHTFCHRTTTIISDIL